MSISVNELERRAGVKPYSIRNILHGKSSKPSAEIVFAIAKEIGCSVEELLSSNFIEGKKQNNPSTLECDNLSVEEILRIYRHCTFDKELYASIEDIVNQYINTNSLIISFWKYIAGVSEIYQYCYENNTKLLDSRYANWWLKRNFK